MGTLAMGVELGLKRLPIGLALRAMAAGLGSKMGVGTGGASRFHRNVSQPFGNADEGLLQSSACHN